MQKSEGDICTISDNRSKLLDNKGGGEGGGLLQNFPQNGGKGRGKRNHPPRMSLVNFS